MEYIIINTRSIASLQEAVQEKIAEGWVPQGGLSTSNASSLIFAQAMIKTNQ